MKNIFQKQNGTALVSLVVGSLVFLICALCVYQGMPVLRRTVDDAQRRYTSIVLARQKLEELKQEASSLPPGTYSFDLEGAVKAQGSYKVAFQDTYLIALNVSLVWGPAPGQRVILATLVRRP